MNRTRAGGEVHTDGRQLSWRLEDVAKVLLVTYI